MMFGKQKEASDDPEVQRAIHDRDDLLAAVDNVVAAVEKVRDEIVEQYREAGGGH